MLSSGGVPDAKMYLYPKEKNQKKYKKLETIKVFSHHQKIALIQEQEQFSCHNDITKKTGTNTRYDKEEIIIHIYTIRGNPTQ